MDYRLPLVQMQHNVASHPDKIWLHQPVNRKWHTYTWAEVDVQARKIAQGLFDQGLTQGDKVAIIAKNSAEWFILDMALMMAGMVSVPIYPTACANNIGHVLSHSQAKAIFIGKLDSTDAIAKAMPDDILSIAFPYPTLACQQQWQDWIGKYEPINELHQAQADDIFSLIYTSGSTGLAKGVVISHKNVAASASSAARLMSGGIQQRLMSYLPLAHVTERCVIELPSLYQSADIYFVESLDSFIDDVRYAEPTSFISVPRLWTKFQSQILATIPNRRLQRILKVPLLGKFVAKKIRTKLGLHKASLFGSGSAPISPEVLRWYHKIGISLGEGWGMTETAGLSCSNIPFDLDHIGTIGTPQDCVEMSLSEQGEILVRGEAVFSGYYKNPEATEAAFVDGWFRTGDKAEILDDGSWKIIGRVKEQFKTSKGKYVAPVPIESDLGRNPDIEQVCVMGSGRSQPIAIVVLGEGASNDEAELKVQLQETLTEVNSELEAHQRLDHLIIVDEPWSTENGLLTPTLKLKREQIEARFNHLLTARFKDPLVWESKHVA
ncbi:AMP-binding protein [Shewanella maritima]|uniref:AMP-binding protein n=1 Tax=Shewanella maritima TaxID=2520507 RepID=UPI0037365D89